MSDRTTKTEILFHEASALKTPEERERYLDESCRDDVDLRHELEDLLEAIPAGDDLFRQCERAAAPRTADVQSKLHSYSTGSLIDRYRILEKIGEGGMGVVYMAEQDEPVRRQVALKIIKMGMDTVQVVARFEAERQALAKMDHPNIARVLDAGATDTGRPFFVMELVQGVPITDFCETNHLRIHQRLQLFIAVCHAIQSAHQKGIIHRDIKPTNVLVTMHNGVPHPMVIDFGVAKAIDQKLTEKTLFTNFATMIGTPAYMSPEQAEMSKLDVDTRSDIYSLGVLLYELLTGTPPFPEERLRSVGYGEMQRIITEEQPERPATRLKKGTLARSSSVPAAGESPLAADLDWIVMKCLEKDRTRRYETANGLAMDIKRHLTNEPVVARPPGRFYQFQKLVRRNRAAVGAAAGIGVALVIGVVVSTWQVVQTRRAQRAVQEQLREAYFAQAQGNRRSSQAGRRVESLDALQKAAALPFSPDSGIADVLALRNETIACLALPDLGPTRLLSLTTSPGQAVNVDADIKRYALVDESGTVQIRGVGTDELLFRLPAAGSGTSRVHGFSPNGRFLAVVYGEQQLRVWDLERKEVALALDDQKKFREVVFSPDSKTLALVHESGDGTIPIYRIATRELARTLKASQAPVSVSFSTDGAFMAIVPEGSTVEIIEVNSGKVISRLPHSKRAYVAAWHPDNRLLAVGSHDLHLYLWNPMTGQSCGSLAGHRSAVDGASFHPNGEFLASTAWDGTVKLWGVVAKEQLIDLGYSGFNLRFSRDGRRLGMFSWEDRRLMVSEVTTLRVCRALAEMSNGLGADYSGGYNAAEFSPDERLVVAAGADGVRLWDVATGRPLLVPTTTTAISAIIHPDGRQLFATSKAGLFRWRLEPAGVDTSWTVLATTIPAETGATGHAVLSHSGTLLAYIQNNGVHLERHGSSPLHLVGKYPPNLLAFSRDESWLAAATYPGLTTTIWDTRTGEPVRDIDASMTPSDIAFSPDSRWLVIASGQEYSFFDVKTGERGRRISVETARAIAFSHNGRLLALSVRNALVKLLDASTAEELATLEAPGAPSIARVTFSPSDSQLAVAGNGRSVQLWDLRTLRAELASRNLDWNQPPYPRAQADHASLTLTIQPLFPTRPAGAQPQLLDLTGHYTTDLTNTWNDPQNTLSGLSPGLHTFGGVKYDIRGSIHVQGGERLDFPREVTGIRVGQKCQRLHFLGGLGYVSEPGEAVATHRIHYASGRIVDVPVIVGRDTDNWWFRQDEKPGGLDVAWTGTNPLAENQGFRIRLLHWVWTNPHPDELIETLDFISAQGSGAPFLVAITAD